MSSPRKLRIGFCWDWPPVLSQVSTWEDGLAAALKVLGERHELGVFMPGDSNYPINHPYFPIQVCQDVAVVMHAWKPDVILVWGDMTRPNIPKLKQLNKPMAICFAGGDPNGEHAPLFDRIFVESKVYYDRLRDLGYPVSVAFGTNTELFAPLEQPQLFDTIFPATFAAWKRHSLYAAATGGLRSLAVGYIYHHHEQECWQECLKRGVTILPHTSAHVLRYLYAASQVCVITSSSAGGSQRTVLEAMAMNLPVIVTDSDKFDFAQDFVFRAEPTAESIQGYLGALLDGQHEADTRQYILDEWSEYQYAKKLEEGLYAIV